MVAGKDLTMAIRLAATQEFIGVVGLHSAEDSLLETGLWIKLSAQRHGYGREALSALLAWAARRFRPSGFLYPVVDENSPSRGLAESLGGEVIGSRQRRKHGDVGRTLLHYRIPVPD